MDFRLAIQIKKEPKPLHNIFTDITSRYDLINHIFTWRMDAGWRLKGAKECLQGNPKRILDLGCGTGDLAITIAKLAKSRIEITGFDFSQPMLDIARHKAQCLGYSITFINGEAENLPFPDEYFDNIGISFAFRNLTYKHPQAKKHIAEILRVLKPGGRFVITESSQPKSSFIRCLDHIYLGTFVYGLGWWLSGNRNAFKYFVESASHYYTAEELRAILLKSGFSKVSFKRLFFGAAAIHIAVK
jgi:demethylmenaquinone methyltransferase/2-methoxy-6-polyprenyl-1,4-benzoquinol methylase